MATPAMPPLNWTCPQCSQQVPAVQTTCPTCAGTGGPPPPTPPRPARPRPAPATPATPAPAPATPAPAPAPATSRPRGTAPATPPATPPTHSGGNMQYQQNLAGVSVSRNENLINHNWYRFLLWMLAIGGFAFLAWLFYGGFLAGWHANPCKPPCVAATAASVSPTSASAVPVRPPRPVPVASQTAARRRPTQPAPQQVQLSGSVDLVHHEAQTQTSTPSAPARRSTRRSTPEELDEATARWLEGQRNP